MRNMQTATGTPALVGVPAAAERLGISHWTLRKHLSLGNVARVQLGKRVFVRTEEIERIEKNGLPPLSARSANTWQSQATGVPATGDAGEQPR
jgi:hypothetical protein